MSIEVNGVTLPDIPSDVLEQYPYAVITHQIYPTANIETYALTVFAEAVHFFSEGSTLNPLDGACNGASFGLGEDGTGTEWTLGNTVENEAVNMPIMSEDYMTIEVVAANYDILTVDADGNATDTVYFAANISVSHPSEYSIPHDDVVFLADQTRRLTGGTGKLGFAEIKSGLESVTQTTLSELAVTANGTYTAGDGEGYNKVTVNVPAEAGDGLNFVSNATGCIPDYDHGYATSTLTLEDMFESTAVGAVS